MTTEIHPEDLELFEYVEGELDGSRLAEVELHIQQCRRCADEIHALEVGKEALQSASLLELPDRRAGLVLGDLPPQDKDERPRVPFFTPKRLIAVLTPVAAVLVVVMVLVNTTGDESVDEAARAPAEPAPAELAPTDAALAPESEPATGDATGEDALPAEASQSAPADATAEAPAEESLEEAAALGPITTVAGPPATAARFLRNAGFNARVRNGAIEVSGASADAVLRALETYPGGAVAVLVTPQQ